LRETIVYYITRHGANLYAQSIEERQFIESSDARILEILKRNPDLVTEQERNRYKFQGKTNESDVVWFEQQRAIIRAYDRALYGLSIILQWPTIISTMIVTLGMGWLGGIVSYMGTAVTQGRSYTFTELFRRSLLGITASLGIFLFAGSGLLVLTAQTGKPMGSSSIELSPYFVAFLAFISGLLADDAFARLTEAGKAIFKSGSGRGRSGQAGKVQGLARKRLSRRSFKFSKR
jgi:hypothetical protein